MEGDVQVVDGAEEVMADVRVVVMEGGGVESDEVVVAA